MKLFKLKNGAPNDHLILDGSPSEDFLGALKDFGYEASEEIDTILRAIALAPEEVEVETPKKKRSLLGL